MTHLRKMMLEELQRRNYSEITTRKYLQYVTCVRSPFWQAARSAGAERTAKLSSLSAPRAQGNTRHCGGYQEKCTPCRLSIAINPCPSIGLRGRQNLIANQAAVYWPFTVSPQ